MPFGIPRSDLEAAEIGPPPPLSLTDLPNENLLQQIAENSYTSRDFFRGL